MLPLVFQNTQRLKYDKPRVKRDRDHLLRPGALFSVKIGSYWFPVGVIDQVDEHGDTHRLQAQHRTVLVETVSDKE